MEDTLIYRLILLLKNENICYCHWKSNNAINKTLSGKNDLDLLVSLDDKKQFLSILSRLKFRRSIAPNEKWFPSIHHYYAYDSVADIMVHIHLHYKLILGFDLIKNYHLPVENAVLNSAVFHESGLKIPSHEFELILLVIRLTLKLRLISLILSHPRYWFYILTKKNSKRLPESAKYELNYLNERIDSKRLKNHLDKYFPFIPPDFFFSCLESFSHNTGLSFLIKSWWLTRILEPYRRYSFMASLIIPVKRKIVLKLNSILQNAGLKQAPKKRLICGGKIIAFIGGDGAGKTTNIKNAIEWFGKYFYVKKIHIGKPPKSIIHFGIKGFVKIWSKIFDYNTFCRIIICWALSRDRYRVFQKAKKLKSKGYIVFLDRIPLESISTMDTPRIHNLNKNRRPFYSLLEKMEIFFHKQINGVDELFVLLLDPIIAIKRRPEDNKENLLKRSGEIWNHDWDSIAVTIINSEKPLNQVVLQIRRHIWDTISTNNKTMEVIGTAGSGKSTISDNIQLKESNILTRFPIRKDKVSYFKNLIKMTPFLLYCHILRMPYADIRRMINLQTTLDILLHQKQQNLQTNSYIFNQGPIFQLCSFYYYFKNRPDYDAVDHWLKSMGKKIFKLMDTIIRIDASDKVLIDRINSRIKPHRIKNTNTDKQLDFINDYRFIFNKVLEQAVSKSIPVININSEELSVEQASDKIIDLL